MLEFDEILNRRRELKAQRAPIQLQIRDFLPQVNRLKAKIEELEAVTGSIESK